MIDDDAFVTGRVPEGVDADLVDPDLLDDDGAWIPGDLDRFDHRPEPRRPRGVGAAMLLGLGRALEQIYLVEPPEPGAIIFEVDDDQPVPDGPVWVEFDPDDPTHTVVHLRNP